jgi:phosphoglycolate phosphatase-like HAD superfamily hydrolase
LSDFLILVLKKLQNPGWGSVGETMAKVDQFYGTDRIFNTKPVPGAREGVQALRDLGYRLIIVTARKEDFEDQSWKWVEQHFPGLCNLINEKDH